jgi:circadian clock protein KaiC
MPPAAGSAGHCTHSAWPSRDVRSLGDAFAPEALPSGIGALDELLGGGLRRGTSTLPTDPSGVGKSSLALQYAMAAGKRGEHASIFAFDERYRTAAERAGLGMNVEEARKSGRLSWEQINPVTLSPGEFVDKVKCQVEAGGDRQPEQLYGVHA